MVQKEGNLLNILFLTQQGGILGPFSWIMGIILDGIYRFVSLFGIHNIALCIVIFTFVMKMLMLPLTIKQQKFSRLSSSMNPELTKINAKYKNKNKKDPEVMRMQQAELQEVYAKYGASPMSGCLPMLITLPIMFALFYVIRAVPAYITGIGDTYRIIANQVTQMDGYVTFINEAIPTTVKNFTGVGEIESQILKLIDVFSTYNPTKWNTFLEIKEIAQLDGSAIENIQAAVASIKSANSFLFGMNILDNAGYMLPGILIPIISTALYFLQNKLMQSQQKAASDVDNPTAQSMKTMTNVMPIMSGVFCVFMPIGIGVYWIASSVFQIIQQVVINKYLDKVDINDMIEKNVEKSTKKKRRYGIDTGNTMASLAKAQTRRITSSEVTTNSDNEKATVSSKKAANVSNYKKSEVSYKASSIAANANILSNRNKEKGDGE